MRPGNVQDLTIPECGIVTPASVKELIPFDAKRAEPGFVLLIVQAVAEVGQTRPRAVRNNLLERIERIEGAHRKANFRSGRRVWRCDLLTIRVERERRMGWDGDCALALGYETIGGVGREFVVLLHVGIVKIAVNPQLIVADLLLERRIAAPALLLWERARESVEVKAREYTARRPGTSSKVNIVG